jgi:hypothetical protein
MGSVTVTEIRMDSDSDGASDPQLTPNGRSERDPQLLPMPPSIAG